MCILSPQNQILRWVLLPKMGKMKAILTKTFMLKILNFTVIMLVPSWAMVKLI